MLVQIKTSICICNTISLCISRSFLFSEDRLSQFTIFGSNETYSEAAPGTQCAYRDENVGDSIKLTCNSPVMAR